MLSLRDCPASRTSAGSTRATLASKPSRKRAGSLSAAVDVNQATSVPSGMSACRHAAIKVDLPEPAGPVTVMQRSRRASSNRISNRSRATTPTPDR